ncbi:unnamed protein product [Allacma fusca]|uniref:Uncharacterized protein n=1 Tax=Allacma fusca TaxID=39272 RepID=A0A8J2PKK0_9HEXA|nr:unnamed protein product [Allacma fusca]
MVKVTMAHLLLLRFAILLVVSSFVQSQLFVHSPIRPVFFLHRPNNRNVQAKLPDRVVYPNSRPNARSDLVSSEEDQNEADATSSEASFEKRNETQLSEDFDRSIRANHPPLEPRPVPPMYGDPAVMEDEDAEQDRSRFLWPFSTTVTLSKQKAHPPHHHHHLSYPPGFPKPPLLPPHLQQQHHHHDHHDLEYEKTRLKYEIYKLKAKKTIAILQNKVELKKILSLLLQQKIKALEWITWYHDYVEQMYNQANGWDSGDGWDGDVKPLTDEEILHSKGYKKYRKKKQKKIKFLKKKLKFKRWVQKMLEKKISYLDIIAPY